MNHDTTYAVDVAKSVFEIAVSHHPGHVRECHRLSRERLVSFFAKQKPATVLLEACGSSHHWARTIQGLGHRVVLLPPHRVRPYVTGNKTDRADAKALLEAARNRDIRPVPVKTIDQQSLAAIHRLRSAWLAARTARINTVRGLLRELGVFIPVGPRHVRPAVARLLEDPDSSLPHAIRPSIAEAADEICEFERRLASTESQLNSLGQAIPDVRLLMTIPGIGLITATALVGFIGSVHNERFTGDPNALFLWGVTLDAKLNLLRPSWRHRLVPYLQVGGGAYGLYSDAYWGTSDLAKGGGFQAGVGLDLYLTRWLSLGARMLYRGIVMGKLNTTCDGECVSPNEEDRTYINGLTGEVNMAIVF